MTQAGNSGGTAPGERSLDYFILRVCERLRLREEEFHGLPYATQLRYLAYGMIRSGDEAAGM